MQKNTSKLLQELADLVSFKIKKARNLGFYTKNIGAGGDKTKRGDALVESIIKKEIPVLLRKYKIKDCLVISEEAGIKRIGKGHDGIFLVIDPIDGSNNMRPHHTPAPFLGFSVAAGLLKDFFEKGNWQAVKWALARDLFHDEIFFATVGQGAFLNNIKIKSSSVVNLQEAVLGTSLDRLGKDLEKTFREGIYDLLLATKCQRRLGSTVLDLCRVATGDYDLYLSLSGGVKIHDIAAVRLIVEEAGGIVEISNKSNLAYAKYPFKELMKLGESGIKKISFNILAAGNSSIFKKAKRIIK